MPKKGKKGVDQRVKGNVKAASSGRMADLLGGELTPGFIGFEAVSRGMGGRDEEEEGGTEEVSHGAGARFQVVMKQLGKRDTTTKIKALQEFSALCDQEPAEAVVSILNIWTLMYNKLSSDNDNRVREASHKALQSCVKKIRNSLGPHLRSIVGCWVAGMCDPYGSAATAAQAAFSAAFVPVKQIEVLKFGFKSIITFVEDVTLKQTQDTFSDPKVVAADERVQRYERVVTMALYGLSLTLQRLPDQLIEEKREEWASFMTEKRLWKLVRHQNPYIRAACFKVVVSLCKHCGDFILAHARQFCSLVLCSLGEKEPGVVGTLWEATLLTIDLCQDWSEHVNVSKALLPGLWQTLSEGGHGSARVVYPCLPRLLTALVQQVYPSDVNFANSFLERLKSGLQADRVRGSASECEAVLQMFSQSLSYLLLTLDTHSLSEGERQQFYRQLLNMVVELVEYSAIRCPKTQANSVCGWVGRILDNLLETGSSHPWIEQHIQGWLQPELTERLTALLEKGSDKAHFVRMASLLESLSTHYSKPDVSQRVKFVNGIADATANIVSSAPNIAAIPTNTVVSAANESSYETRTIGEQIQCNEDIGGRQSKPATEEGRRPFAREDKQDVHGENENRDRTKKMSKADLNARMSFLRPAIAGLCAHCIGTIVRRQSVEHCTLLCVALRLYGETDTVVRIRRLLGKSIGTGGEGGGEVGDGGGGMEEGQERGGRCEGYKEDREDGEGRGGVRARVEDGAKVEGGVRGKGEATYYGVTEVVVCLSNCLLRAIDRSLISGSDPQLVEGVVSSLLLLLQIDSVSTVAVTDLLYGMVQDHPRILLLLLTKLGEREARSGREWVKILLSKHQSLLLQLVRGGEGGGGGVIEGTFLWPFLDCSLTSLGSFGGEDGVKMKGSVFETVSGLLQAALCPEGPEHNTIRTQRLLETLARTSTEVVEDYFTLKSTDGCGLLHCMLHWCLDNCRTDTSLLVAVCQAYSRLVSLLPEPARYLESTADLLTSLMPPKLDRVFEMAVTVHLLHSLALKSYGTFWSLYQPLRPSSPADKTGFLPLGSLESFCFNRPYSPLFTDLSSDDIVTTLTGPRLVSLFLATTLCKPTTLRTALDTLGFDTRLASLGSSTSSDDTSSSVANLSVIFPVQDSPQEKKSYYRLWRTTVCEVMLALTSLQPSQCMQQSSMERAVMCVLHCALEQCLVVGSDDHHHWNGQLLDELIERASMEGPLWCLVLQQFISALESSMGPEERATVLPDFISSVLRDMEPGLVLGAVSGLSGEGQAEVEGRLMGSVRGRESDICFLCVCLHLLPTVRGDLLSLVSRSLSDIASQHASSEITLFESVGESIQDPMVFSLLEVVSLLCAAQSVPSDAWDFILCALVTITHLMSEATAEHKSSVNYTVFYCKAMRACHSVAVLLTSPLSPEPQASEWREFFSPDIQSRLLPDFLNNATQSTPELPSHCQTLQCYYLARTVAEVCCSAIEGLSLETLIDILFSPLYPFKVTAFLLAERLVSTAQFRVEGDTTTSLEETTIMTVPELRALLTAAMGRVNLDLTFQVDPADDVVDGCHDHTLSYLFLSLLLIEIMSYCGPEARASLAEWLKERSLAPHLLHGLFTVLTDKSPPPKRNIEVTLQPDLETLCAIVYCSVARHLPSMLRQWYLSVDRWTSSAVTGFTTKYVSPALQQAELEAVGKTTTTHDNMEVRAYVGVSEVSVVYHLHEFSIELFVHLPTNYPLQPPSIREGRRVKVEASQWRKWMLQLNVFIANQNGTLMDGLLLWKSNLDKHFSGIEDCMICFSVIHGSLYSLPKMTCRTCKKKFHSACLYKWFSTSNKSSCPLCRNIF